MSENTTTQDQENLELPANDEAASEQTAPEQPAEETSSKKHVVQEGRAYVELSNGALTRNYVVLGGKRFYVKQKPGSEITAEAAKKQSR